MATSTPPTNAPILIAVDLLPHSSDALRQGLRLAREHHTSAVILHVAHETADHPNFYRAHAPKGSTLPMEAIAETMLEDFLASELPLIPASQLPKDISSMIVSGIPATRIAEVAEQVNADCIVLASSGHKGLASLWHGSVVESLKKSTDRELRVLQPPADESLGLSPKPTAATPALS